MSAVDDAPVAFAASLTVAEGGTATTLDDGSSSVLASATDAEGDALTAVIVSGPAHGSLVLGADGRLSYTHDGSQATSDSFSFQAFDGQVASEPVVVTIHVTPANDAPVAAADSVSVDEAGSATTLVGGASSVLANDEDGDGDALSAVLVDGPAHGALTLAADGSFRYVHDGSETTVDGFSYQADDGVARSAVVTVSIAITAQDDAPVAVADEVRVAEGGTVSALADGATSVLANDLDAEHDALTATLVRAPSHGTLTLRADGSFAYAHDGSETTSDSFAYRADDGTTTSPEVVVAIRVTPVNDAPTISLIADQALAEDGASQPLTFTVGDDDDDAAALVVSATSSDDGVVSAHAIAFGGSGAARTLVVTPAANAFGTSVITVSVSDGEARASTHFQVRVAPVDDPPHVSPIADQALEEDVASAPIAFTVGDVETDAADIAVRVTSSDDGLVPAAGIIVAGSGAERSIQLVPAADASGAATITVSVQAGEASIETSFRVAVRAVNDAPSLVVPSHVTVAEDSSRVVTGVAVADRDAGTGDLAVTLEAGHGKVSLGTTAGLHIASGANGSRAVALTGRIDAMNAALATLAYAGDRDYVGADIVTVTIDDLGNSGVGGELSASAPIAVEVTPVDDAPSLAALADQTLTDPESRSLALEMSDADDANAKLIATVASSDETVLPADHVTFDTADGVKSLVLVSAGHAGKSTLTLTVQDPAGQRVSRSLEVTVVCGEDLDGDGICDGTDLDTDGDGIPDVDEGTGDLDGDGTPDVRDPTDDRVPPEYTDSDGDGISDPDELAAGTNPHSADTDGDGLDDKKELDDVGTDPLVADSDGDGLDDKQERAVASDPRRVDTDGDTLSDFDEVNRWGTSPSSVDTDGDARGGDPSNPRPPLFALFDAAELRLAPDVNDPSQLVPGFGATSPFLADSDGDGRGDYEETLGGVRSPNVAEVPTIALYPTPNATMDLELVIERTTSSGQTVTQSEVTNFSEDGYVTQGSSVRLALQHSQYSSAYVEGTGSVGCCSDILSGDVEVGVSVKSEDRLSQEVRFDLEIGGGFEGKDTQRQTREAVSRQEITVKGATLRTPLDVVNTSSVPVRVQDLVLGLMRFDRVTGTYTPIVELDGEDMTLAPGERRTLSLASDDIPYQAVQDLGPGDSLAFSPTRFALLDADGKDFDFQMDQVLQQTAVLDVDFGDHNQRYFVAAHADASHGITIGEAMREVGMPFEAEPVDVDGVPGVEGWAITIGGRGTELYQGPAPDLHDRLPYTFTSGPGPRLVKRGWFAAVQRFGDRKDTRYYENLFDAPVYPGDRVTLIYSEDLDRDGVSAFAEAANGSSDNDINSDATAELPQGDGLSDFWETNEGWMVETSARAAYRVFPSPALLDSDGDGLRDDEEAKVLSTDHGTGTDPWLADTDGDGLDDLFESSSQTYDVDPNSYVDIADLPGADVTCTITPRPRPNGIEPWRYQLEVSATDPQSDLVSVRVDYLQSDAFMVYQRTPADAAEPAPTATISFSEPLVDCTVDPKQVVITTTDAIGQHVSATCEWAEGYPVSEELCNGVDDDCDGYIDDGCPVVGGALAGQPSVDVGTGTTSWAADGDGSAGAPLSCPPDRIFQKFDIRWGDTVDQIAMYCAKAVLHPELRPGQAEYVYRVQPEEAAVAGWAGGNGGSQVGGDACAGSFVTGIYGRSGDDIDAFGVECHALEVRRGGSGQWQMFWSGGSVKSATGGGNGGSPFSRGCGSDLVGTSLDTLFSDIVQDLRLSCRNFGVPLSDAHDRPAPQTP
ncbi:MAG: Ig-like domain-containing protein [Myxococcota bacterium]